MKIKLSTLPVALCATLVVALATNAYGQAKSVTYVDATDGASGNTTMTDGSTWTAGTNQYDPNGEWDVRAFGNDPNVDGVQDSANTIYQTQGSGATQDVHPLLTTLSGLDPNSPYRVYVYFWSDVSQWGLFAGLDPNNLSQYRAFGSNAAPATPNTTHYGPFDGTSTGYLLSGDPNEGTDVFTSSLVNISDGNRRLYEADLTADGLKTSDSSGEIKIYIDDQGAAYTDSNFRTWYDGVGYQLIPEPTSFALLFAGMAASVVFRRRI